MQRFLLLSIISVLSFGLNAQELGLHFMDNVYQSSFTNPGKISNSRIHVGLPSFIVNYGHNGPTIGSMLTTNSEGENVIDIDAGLAKLKDNNFLKTDFGTETFSVGLGFGKLQVGISHAVRSNFVFGYPRELPEMAFNGNVQYIDQTVDIGPSVNMTVYSELALHGAYQVSDKLSVGARLKILSGVGNISTGNDNLSIYTDPDYYQITATTDYEINSSGTFFDLDIVTAGDSTDFNLNAFSEDLSASDFIFGKNTGVAIDLGAEFKVNDKLTVGASIVDLGSIKWKQNSSTFTSNGSYTFEGINADDVFFGDDSINFEGIVDTIVDILKFTESNAAYSTALPAKFYLSGSYDIKDDLTAGAVLYGEVALDKLRPALGLSIQKRFGKIFSLGGVYAVRSGRFDNLGINFGLKLGPMQLYGTTDNVISVFRPLHTKSVNFRMGLNVAIGKKKDVHTGRY